MKCDDAKRDLRRNDDSKNEREVQYGNINAGECLQLRNHPS